jgi:preprotein translocase subunit SecY
MVKPVNWFSCLAYSLAVLAAIVFIEKAQRRIPVNYAQKQQGRRVFTAQQSHLPLKINMAGVFQRFCKSLLFQRAWVNG